MTFTVYFWATLIAVFLVNVIFGLWWKRRKLPPGPRPYPFIGNLMAFRGFDTHEVLQKMNRLYGDVMTIFLGNRVQVIVNKYEIAKEIFPLATFSDRPSLVMTDYIFGKYKDIGLDNYGPQWHLNKKSAAKCLRMIIENEKLEDKIVDVVDASATEMLKQEIAEPRIHMLNIFYNTITLFAFGKSYQSTDPEFQNLIYLNDTINRKFFGLMKFEGLPLVDKWPLDWIPSFRKVKELFQEEIDFCKKQIDEHRSSYQHGEPRDFCDAILQEQEQLKNEGQTTLEDEHLPLILMDFFAAGTDTSANMLNWFILFMVCYPDIQEECYRNIKEAIGDRHPRLSDRTKLPFVEACLMETLRLRPIAPTGMPHTTTSDATIGNYSIPKGTAVLGNIYAMHVDPAYWEKPLDFDPRFHFLDENGQLKKPLSYVPFGFGRRVCLGETIAKKDLFLAAVRILQKLRFEKIKGNVYRLDQHPEIDIALKARPYFVSVSARE